MTILLLPYHGYGHFNPALTLAKALQEAGHTPHLAGTPFFRRYISAQGFPFHNLQALPFAGDFERWQLEQRHAPHLYWSTLRARWSDQLYHERKAALLQILDTVQPDVILLDAVLATDFIILYPELVRRSIRLALIHAMLPTHMDAHRPPANSDLLPDNRDEVRRALRDISRRQRLKRWRQRIYYWGMDVRTMLYRRLILNRIPRRYWPATASLMTYTPEGLEEWILLPEAYDFPIPGRSHRHYIGYLPLHRVADPANEAYRQWRTQNHPGKSDRMLVYCSWGTIATEHLTSIIALLERIIRAAQNLNAVVVIALKAQPQAIEKLPVSEHVHIFPAVDQVDLLSIADIFVTHGGLGSVKEAIEATVPMLMYPVHNDFDPRGNAARVVHHQLGLRGNVQEDSVEQIQDYLTHLYRNPQYKRNLQQLRKQNAQYGPAALLKRLIELRSITNTAIQRGG